MVSYLETLIAWINNIKVPALLTHSAPSPRPPVILWKKRFELNSAVLIFPFHFTPSLKLLLLFSPRLFFFSYICIFFGFAGKLLRLHFDGGRF